MTDQTALDNIRIVLVNTSHPGNIGAAARAMKNMGLNRLYLVEPKAFPHPKAIWRSAHATDVVENAVVVDTLDEAIADCGLVVGTSARRRSIPWPLMDARESGLRCIDEAQQTEVAVVFGREATGLSNEELQKCQWHVHIPTSDDYSSLNLASAVQVVSYELQMAAIAHRESAIPQSMIRDNGQPQASNKAMELFYQHLEQVLTETDFLHEHASHQSMPRLRRMFTRMRPDQVELAMLRGILKSVERSLQSSGKDKT